LEPEGSAPSISRHQFNRRKPSPERFGAEIPPDSARYFPPNPIASLLHRVLLFTLLRDILILFAGVIRRDRQKK
jgi:hypothetical protein